MSFTKSVVKSQWTLILISWLSTTTPDSSDLVKTAANQVKLQGITVFDNALELAALLIQITTSSFVIFKCQSMTESTWCLCWIKRITKVLCDQLRWTNGGFRLFVPCWRGFSVRVVMDIIEKTLTKVDWRRCPWGAQVSQQSLSCEEKEDQVTDEEFSGGIEQMAKYRITTGESGLCHGAFVTATKRSLDGYTLNMAC